MSRRALQRAVAVSMCAGVLVGVGGTAATAGEITGKGRSLATVENPDHDPTDPESSELIIKGRSICAYSGLNDEFVGAQLDDDPSNDTTYPRVQTAAEAPPGLVGFACSVARPVG